MSYYSNDIEFKVILILTFILVTLMFAFAIYDTAVSYKDPHFETITVKDKSIMPGEDEKWLVYTEEEVYSINDLFFAGFFTSADVYNSIEVGNTYDVFVSGKRIPFLSKYKTIRQVKLAKE